MKDAALTIRIPMATRRRIEALAKKEGRSLSSQVERLIELALEAKGGARSSRAGSTSGLLDGGLVPELAHFREARGELSASLLRRARQR